MQPHHRVRTAKPPLTKDEDPDDRGPSPDDVGHEDHDAEQHPRRGHPATCVLFTLTPRHDGSADGLQHRGDQQHANDAVQPEQFVEREANVLNERGRSREQERFVCRERVEEPDEWSEGQNGVPPMSVSKPGDHREQEGHPQTDVQIEGSQHQEKN